MVGEEEECVYPLGFSIACKEFFVEVDVAFGVYTGLCVVGFEFDGAVDVVVVEGFVEVSAVTEDSKGGVPAIDIPVLGVIGV